MPKIDDSLRAFVAIEIPEIAHTFLSRISADLKKTRADVKWVRPEGIHLTLKFLGQIPGSLVPVLDEKLSQMFAEFRPFEIHVKGLGAFPSLGKPRVVWAGVKDDSQTLVTMAQRLDDVIAPLGFEREKRPFNPHLTLGRVKSNAGKAEMVDSIRQKMDASGPRFISDHAVLFQSILKPSGAEYRSLCRFDFAAGSCA